MELQQVEATALRHRYLGPATIPLQPGSCKPSASHFSMSEPLSEIDTLSLPGASTRRDALEPLGYGCNSTSDPPVFLFVSMCLDQSAGAGYRWVGYSC